MGNLTAGTARLAYHRRRTDALFGAKVGHRGERFGLFARVRPGVARLSDRGLGCDGELCALILVARPLYRTEFAFDVGVHRRVLSFRTHHRAARPGRRDDPQPQFRAAVRRLRHP